MSIQVIKADGVKEPFLVEKLERSLRRSGASHGEVAQVIEKITPTLFDGISTEQIYREAFQYLNELGATSAITRYSLRRALFGLGPTGFPFEDFLVRLFAAEGYETKARLVLQGKCVAHEVDLAAYNGEDAFVAEAKFHSRPGVKSDLKVALYCKARQDDLQTVKICADDYCGIKRLRVITNTKFTHTAEHYAECAGLELLSWDYPKKNNLHDLIQRNELYPVTVLRSLSGKEKSQLLSSNIIVCKDIIDKPQALSPLHLSKEKTEAVFSEIRQLCTK